MRADPRALFWIRLDGDLPDRNEGAQYWGWWSMESVRLVKLIGRQRGRHSLPHPCMSCTPFTPRAWGVFVTSSRNALDQLLQKDQMPDSSRGPHTRNDSLILLSYLDAQPRLSFLAPWLVGHACCVHSDLFLAQHSMI